MIFAVLDMAYVRETPNPKTVGPVGSEFLHLMNVVNPPSVCIYIYTVT